MRSTLIAVALIFVFCLFLELGPLPASARLDLSPNKTQTQPAQHDSPETINDGLEPADAVDEDGPFQCTSNETSFHSDRNDCHSYYICFNNTASHHTCPIDMAYHCEMNLCISDLYTPGCAPPVHCGQNGFIADPKNCTKFYQCAHGHPYSMQCPAGTRFDPVSVRCSPDVPCLTKSRSIGARKACFTG